MAVLALVGRLGAAETYSLGIIPVREKASARIKFLVASVSVRMRSLRSWSMTSRLSLLKASSIASDEEAESGRAVQMI